MSTWSGTDIARAFGIVDEGLVVNGAFCLNTPLGLAVPSLYRGDVEFLQWLGVKLPSIVSNLGRLGLSQLVQAPTGDYYARVDGEVVLLSTLETGPTCDPHNAFELFTVAAGLAHVHQQTLGVANGRVSDWLMYYESQRDKLAQLKPPSLSKRALVAWTFLEEAIRVCMEEAVNGLKVVSSVPCLNLGLTSFTDFIYLADRHLVHYNSIERCCIDSPAVEIAHLLASTEGEIRIAHNMLLSYQRVRKIPCLEAKELLAHLWFPHEVGLDLLTDQSVNPLTLQRAYNLLQDKIGMISELEDILLASEEEVAVQEGKEILTMSKRKEGVSKVLDTHSQGIEAGEVPQDEIEVSREEQQESSQQAVQDDKPDVVESMDRGAEHEELPHISMEAIVTKKATVWGPFPRPLGATEEPDQVEQQVTDEVAELVQEGESEAPSEPE